ncbi:MAG: hypothetical protein J5906_08215 [Acidaminococcaceae bacterium]|nr:hypothetical protein [Acidaminococcaceae bacterium]
MKRILAFLFSIFTIMCINLPFTGTAEAAWVAVIPIDINVDKVERSSDFNSYYWDIMIEKFQYPDYELIDDDKVAAVVPEEGLKTYDKATLQSIAEKVDADIVVAMKLDEIKERPQNFRREPSLETFMKGEYAGYNRLTDKYYYKKMYHKGEIEEVLTLRTDWQQQVFASELKRYINRTMEDKKAKTKI